MASDFVFEVDSRFEVGLVSSLAALASAGDDSELREWLAAQRARESRESLEIEDRLRRLRKVVEAFAGFHRSYRESAHYNAAAVSATYLQEMETALSKAIEIDTPPPEEAEPLRTLFRTRRFRELEERLQRLAASDHEMAASRFLNGYRRSLLDRQLLVGELLDLLIAKYNRRVETTRKRLRSFGKLIERSAQRIEGQLALIDRTMDELQNDARLKEEERRQLLSTFARRRGELLIAESSLGEMEQAAACLLRQMRVSLDSFRNLAASLGAKLAQQRARDSYLWRLIAVGSQVPELRPLLAELADALRANVGAIQSTFLLFNEPFQNSLLTAIESQQGIRRILLTAKGSSGVRVEIPITPRTIDAGGEEAAARLDLSFLAPIEARAVS